MKFFACVSLIVLLGSCAVTKQGGGHRDDALERFLSDSLLATAHVGVSVFDLTANREVANHDALKLFVPASNMKLFTCYATMKYGKHFLTGIRYYENDTAVYLLPTGDPTLLHPQFLNQPVIRFLQAQKKKIYVSDASFHDEPLGRGWSWDDYNDDYMAERNALPVYGNTIRWIQQAVAGNEQDPQPSMSVFSQPEVNWKLRFETGEAGDSFYVRRDRDANVFHVTEGSERHAEQVVPFVTNGIRSAVELLADTVGQPIGITNRFQSTEAEPREILSQPVDSALRWMMYNSDNFFAEQLLEMLSARMFGVMNARMAIDSILHSDFANWQQRPVWVDGSGMSRYNLSSPEIFVQLLMKMRNEFGMDRLKLLLPSGNAGTLKGYFANGEPYVYAKTGSMSGVMSLSGFVYTVDKRLLVFSVMVNNFTGSARPVKRRIERFIDQLSGR